jgi:hypothetical protein
MRGARRIAVLAAVTAVFLLAGLIAPASASASGSIDVLLSDLSSPKGLSVGLRSADLILSQGAFSAPAPVLRYVLRGADKGETEELSPPENVVDIAVGADGSVWAIGGDRTLYRVPPGGGSGPEAIVNIPTYQETDPDPFNAGEDPPDGSNPYGVAVLPSGDALVADAQNNDLLRVTPEGDVTTVARFDTEEISTDHLPPEVIEEEGLPPTIDAEAVPTSVTLGPGGWVYVGELKGFPFRPGTSHVWAVNPDADGAVCSVDTSDADCKVAYEGFTAINDIAYNAATATLYVYELAEDGVFAFESGFETGDFPPAVLLEVKKNKITELAAGKLSQPGGIVTTNRGQVFVTDGMFACNPETGEDCEGRLVQVHR